MGPLAPGFDREAEHRRGGLSLGVGVFGPGVGLVGSRVFTLGTD